MRHARATSDARRMIREAKSVLASELRAAPSDLGASLVATPPCGTSSNHVGVSVVCVSQGALLVLPPDVAAGGYPYTCTWEGIARSR